MDWIAILLFLLLGLGCLVDVISGLLMYKKDTELPSRKTIASHYVTSGIFGVAVATLFLIALFN
jgi:hypothetical protein